MARRIALHSPLDPVAVATRLRDVLGDRSKPAAGAGVTGNGSVTEMTLFYYRPNLQNSFQTRLIATMDAEGSGTRIAGKIGVAGGVKVFMALWFGFLIAFMAVPIAGFVYAGEVPEGMWPLIAIPLAMMGFGVLLWKLGTWNGAKDEAAILLFLADTLEARPIA